MAGLAAALLLALNAAAQSPMPYSSDAPAASTAPAVSTAAVAASTTTAEVAVSTGGVHVAGAEPKAKLKRPIRATIHPDSKDWEPLSLKAGGDPVLAESKAVLLQYKVKGKYKGAPSKARSTARLIRAKDAQWLVLSVFPKALEKRRSHFEVRLRLVEGFIEDVKATLVTIVDRRTGGALLNSDELRSRGVEFEEDSPASGQVLISALDPRPSKTAFNAGSLRQASFASKEVGLADFSWSATGLTVPK